MKILFFIFIFLITTDISLPQQTVIDSLQKQINELKEAQDKEFIKKVDAVVKTETFDYVSKVWSITGLVVSVLFVILGYFGYKFTGSWIRDLKEKINDSVIKEIDNKVAESMKKEYNKITQRQNTFFVEIKFDRLKDKYEIDKGFTTKEVNNDFINLMEDCVATENKEFIANLMSELVIFLFDKTYYETLTELINRYEKSSSFDATTWANVAIANMTMYVVYSAKQYKDMALRSSKNSLDVLPKYGEPQAVKLILYSFDILKKPSLAQEEKTLELMNSIFEELNSGSDTLTAYETYNYLYNKLGDYYNDFRKILRDKFPEQMKELETRYDTYKKSLNITDNPESNLPQEDTKV